MNHATFQQTNKEKHYCDLPAWKKKLSAKVSLPVVWVVVTVSAVVDSANVVISNSVDVVMYV